LVGDKNDRIISFESQNSGVPVVVDIVDASLNPIGAITIPEALSEDGNTLEVSFVSDLSIQSIGPSIGSTIIDITLRDKNLNSITQLSENIEICLEQEGNVDVCIILLSCFNQYLLYSHFIY